MPHALRMHDKRRNSGVREALRRRALVQRAPANPQLRFTVYAAQGEWMAPPKHLAENRKSRRHPQRVPVGETHAVLRRETVTLCGLSINGLEPFPRTPAVASAAPSCPGCQRALDD